MKTEEIKSSALDESKLSESGKKLLADLKAQFEVKKSGEETKGIPNFWLETLQAFRITSEMIQEHDEAVLAYLQDIRVQMHDQKPLGYTLEFEFSDNPYFSNKVLTKTFELKIDIDSKDPFSFDGPCLERCYGCKIDWKPNKNVTVRLIKKKIKGRNKKAPPKIVTKEEKQDSFFLFFETRSEANLSDSKNSKTKSKVSQNSESGGEASSSSNKNLALKSGRAQPDEEDDDDDEMDEMAAHELYLMTEFETGQYFKDKIIPNAVLYFSGELDELEDGDDYEDEYDEDEDEEDDDIDNDDDDDEDDEEDNDDNDHNKGSKKMIQGSKQAKKGNKSGNKEFSNEKSSEPTPSECKQT